jgi:hypothetical protein
LKCEFCEAYFFNTQQLRVHVVTVHPWFASDEWKEQVLGPNWRARFPELDRDADREQSSTLVETSSSRQRRLSASATTSVGKGEQAVL